MEQNGLILSLPVDLLVEDILSRLSLWSLTACLSVCRQLYTIIISSTLLSYIMELEKEGMIDNPYCSYDILPRGKRLEILRERASRWKHLDVKWRTRINWPQSNTWNFDTCFATPAASQMLVIPGRYDVEGALADEAYFARLPVTLDTPVAWEKINFGKEILGIGMAIEEHGLVVCATSMPSLSNLYQKSVQIHLRRRSTGEPHPSALSPVLDICTIGPTEQNLDVRYIYISGENLIFTVRYEDDSGPQYFLNIWNWKTGCAKANVKRSFDGGAAFLREDLLVVPNSLGNRNSLDILYIPPSSESSYCHSNTVRGIQSLLLPELAQGANTAFFASATTSASVFSVAEFPPHTDPSQPFVNDPLNAILAFKLGINIYEVQTRLQEEFPKEDFTFVTRRVTLLNRALDALANFTSPNGNGEAITSWELWGPQGTRWFPHNLTRTDSFSTLTDFKSPSGTRYSSSHIEFDFENHFEVLQVEILNFGVPALLQSLSGSRKSSSLMTRAFAKPMISHLPCVVTELPLKMAEGIDVGHGAPLDLNTARLDWNAVTLYQQCVICHLKDESGFEVLYFG